MDSRKYVLTTLMLLAWEFEDEGIPDRNNLAKWLVFNLVCKRRCPSPWG